MSVVQAKAAKLAQEKSMSEAEGRVPLGVAVVGCGYWGPNLIRNFTSVDNCELRAVCDTDVDRLEPIR